MISQCHLYRFNSHSLRSLLKNELFISTKIFERVIPSCLTKDVIFFRYYFDQACFTIAKNYINKDDIPPAGDRVYNWPPDLLRPDMIFFLNFLKDPTTDEFTHRYFSLGLFC